MERARDIPFNSQLLQQVDKESVRPDPGVRDLLDRIHEDAVEIAEEDGVDQAEILISEELEEPRSVIDTAILRGLTKRGFRGVPDDAFRSFSDKIHSQITLDMWSKLRKQVHA